MRRGRTGALLLAMVMAVVVGCAPPPGAASTDALDLGSLGVFAEPDLVVTARMSEDYSPRGPRSTTLVVTAADSAGNVVKRFTMTENNVSGPITPPVAPGEFAGIFEPPHLRTFTVAAGYDDPGLTTAFGTVVISEIQTGDFTPGLNGWTYDLTRLRASFDLLLGDAGLVRGYLTIG